MGLKDRIVSGIVTRPPCVLIYGDSGVGKTEFAYESGIEKEGEKSRVIFIGPEQGSNRFDVDRLQSQSWTEVMTDLKAILEEDHNYTSLAVDSIDWIEKLLHAHICKQYGENDILKVDGGWAKGLRYAKNEWGKFIDILSQIREHKNMKIVLIAHYEKKKHYDPQHGVEFDRYQLKLDNRAAGLFREFVDDILFARFDEIITQTGKQEKPKMHSNGARVVYTEKRPAFDAKNRNGLPFSFPLGWNEYAKRLKANEQNPKDLIESIHGLLTNLQDENTIAKVKETTQKAGSDVLQLEKIKNKLLIRIGEQNV